MLGLIRVYTIGIEQDFSNFWPLYTPELLKTQRAFVYVDSMYCYLLY